MEKQGLNELAAVVHENAVAHGWWEQEKEAKQLFGWYSELKKAGFTDAQAFELIKG